MLAIFLFTVAIVCSNASVLLGEYESRNCQKHIFVENSKTVMYGNIAAKGESFDCDGETDRQWGPFFSDINDVLSIFDETKKIITWENGEEWKKTKDYDYKEFNGVYSDPNHPACTRMIVVQSPTSANIYGGDAEGGEGVACNATNTVYWGPLPAVLSDLNITADFSSKGGPSDLDGYFRTTSRELEWEDGNAWKRISVA